MCFLTAAIRKRGLWKKFFRLRLVRQFRKKWCLFFFSPHEQPKIACCAGSRRLLRKTAHFDPYVMPAVAQNGSFWPICYAGCCAKRLILTHMLRQLLRKTAHFDHGRNSQLMPWYYCCYCWGHCFADAAASVTPYARPVYACSCSAACFNLIKNRYLSSAGPPPPRSPYFSFPFRQTPDYLDILVYFPHLQ